MGGTESVGIPEQKFNKMKIEMGCKKQAFQSQRNRETIEHAVEFLSKIAVDLSKLDYHREDLITDGILKQKILFIVVNTYTKPEYKLGVGPLNDSINCAINHIKMGYKVFFLHNSTPHIFKGWLKFVLKNVQNDLTIFYTGHGASIEDEDGDEDDGYDEVMLFDDGYVLDDELCKYLIRYAHGTRILLLTDCCHSGTMWDLDSGNMGSRKLPPNIISISAAKDSQTAKQTKMNERDQGIFSFYFWKIIRHHPNITSNQMMAKINPIIARYKQNYTQTATSEGLLDKPIFS